MNGPRSIKHRSLNVNAEAQPMKVTRPGIGERHKSAPLVARARQVNVMPLTSDRAGLRNPAVGSAPDRQPALTTDPEKRPIINLAVIGNSRVGKTTFMRNALGLNKTTSNLLLSSDIVLNNEVHRVQLCETRLDCLECRSEQPFSWPGTVGDHSFPVIDGILCLYDITNENSIIGIPQALHAMSKLELPIMMIACKADAHISDQEVGITFIERIRQSFPLVTFGESSSISTQDARRCLVIALKATLAVKKLGISNTAGSDGDDDDLDQSLLMRAKTTDAKQKQQPSPAQPIQPDSAADPSFEQTRSNSDGNRSGRSHILEPFPQYAPSSPGSTGMSNTDNVHRSSPSRSHAKGSIPQVPDQRDQVEGGIPFLELVDRLLRLPVTKNDAKFVPAFLCLYRSFATSRSLLVAIMDRFFLTDQSDMVPLTKVGELLRYLQVLSQWTAQYPGDFAQSSVRRLAISFAQDLENTKNFGPAAKEILKNLLTIIMDDDRDWAYGGSEEEEDNVPRKSIASSFSSFSSGKRDSNQTAESENSEDDRDGRRGSVRNSGTASTASSVVHSTLITSQSATNLFNLESAREQSRLFKSVPHISLTKVQWRQFMNTPTEELAQEITRMDWTMFSAIRTRDFVRHVSLSTQQRSRLKHADTIGMMVKHFNHLALFVSGMILLRDKPKHRARMLEKFMDLAWKVRQLNNYNSLGAIVAGVVGPEISRLAQTYDMISNDVQKQFLRLTVLMSHSRSHAAYRMAWENSFSERIPYIPLVRQDLTMAVSANPTFIGKNINWKKFEIMGDVIVGIHKSHEQPYSFPEKSQRSQEITQLILETKVIEESEDSADPRGELYDRSVQLEPSRGGESRRNTVSSGVRRTMTGWFQN